MWLQFPSCFFVLNPKLCRISFVYVNTGEVHSYSYSIMSVWEWCQFEGMKIALRFLFSCDNDVCLFVQFDPLLWVTYIDFFLFTSQLRSFLHYYKSTHLKKRVLFISVCHFGNCWPISVIVSCLKNWIRN